MNIDSAFAIVLALFAPLIVLIVFGRIRVLRKRAALGLAGDVPPKPFDPAPEATPGIFLRRFPLPQRTYLRQQAALARIGGSLLAWIFFIFLSASLLPSSVDRSGIDLTLSQRVWYSYLHNFLSVTMVAAFFAFLTGAIAVAPLKVPKQADFFRTRPLSLSFLFWSRVGLALASLLSGIIFALLVSFLLLLAVYGPVWRHLMDIATHVPPGSASGSHPVRMVFLGNTSSLQAWHLIRLLQSSLPRLMLSLLTTATLIFSALLALYLQPWGKGKKTSAPGNIKPSTIFLILIVGASEGILGGYLAHAGHRFSAWFRFLYMDAGPPPPYAVFLIPIVLSAAFLWLAGYFYRRLEI
ncbi:hypothetical protein [Granulicella mallensis]|uniref:Uncharacterized protein n=1 Tax=Granulicella mallensis TaxID=940614 RepID=A0A7W7ZQE5_9BACT|nr:hypothetical protein [Granulicella mallensis]MBB5063913.1 hypothetical protein [Granulicella mallensis]